MSASMVYKNERRYKIGHYKKYNTNLLNLVENKLDYKRRNIAKRESSSRYADSKCARIGKDEESARKANWRNVDSKIIDNQETFQQLTSQLQQMQEQMNSMNSSGEFHDMESNYSGRLSHVSSQPVTFSSSRSMLSRDTRLPFDTWKSIRSAGKRFLEINFLRMIHPEIFLKELHLTTCKEIEKQYLTNLKGKQVWQVETDKIMAQFQCRLLRQDRWLPVLQYRWNYRRSTWSDSKDSKYRNCNSINSLHFLHSYVGR